MAKPTNYCRWNALFQLRPQDLIIMITLVGIALVGFSENRFQSRAYIPVFIPAILLILRYM